jgi:hypothetical protein
VADGVHLDLEARPKLRRCSRSHFPPDVSSNPSEDSKAAMSRRSIVEVGSWFGRRVFSQACGSRRPGYVLRI